MKSLKINFPQAPSQLPTLKFGMTGFKLACIHSQPQARRHAFPPLHSRNIVTSYLCEMLLYLKTCEQGTASALKILMFINLRTYSIKNGSMAAKIGLFKSEIPVMYLENAINLNVSVALPHL